MDIYAFMQLLHVGISVAAAIAIVATVVFAIAVWADINSIR